MGWPKTRDLIDHGRAIDDRRRIIVDEINHATENPRIAIRQRFEFVFLYIFSEPLYQLIDCPLYFSWYGRVIEMLEVPFGGRTGVGIAGSAFQFGDQMGEPAENRIGKPSRRCPATWGHTTREIPNVC